jgi:hypothetical protein
MKTDHSCCLTMLVLEQSQSYSRPRNGASLNAWPTCALDIRRGANSGHAASRGSIREFRDPRHDEVDGECRFDTAGARLHFD